MNESVDLAKKFFYHTGRRATPATMKQAIGQAKILLESGFSHNEIEIGIRYCCENPPKNGFFSLGWLSYDLENILIKVKASTIKQEQQMSSQYIITHSATDNTKHYKENDKRVNNDFCFDDLN